MPTNDKAYKVENVLKIVRGLERDIKDSQEALRSLRGQSWEQGIERDTRTVVKANHMVYNTLLNQKTVLLNAVVTIPEVEHATEYIMQESMKALEEEWDELN